MKNPTSVATATFFAICVFVSSATQAKELIEDPHFQRGLIVKSPTRGEPEEGTLGVSHGVVPVWHLAQWHSKHSIASVKAEPLSSGAVKFENQAKTIILGRREINNEVKEGENNDEADLTLAVDSRPEYGDACRVPIQNWPHLLVEQSIQGSASIAEMRSLRLHLQVKLLYDECFKLTDFQAEMHTAQVPYVLIVQNTNPQSPGYKDFLWFLVPIYDTRYDPVLPPYVAEDTADPSAKLIYNPGSKALGDYNLHNLQWHTIDVDLLPFLRQAFEAAWEKGYLKGSKDLADYRVVSMNFGWEVTGVNRAAIAIKNLSLDMTTEK